MLDGDIEGMIDVSILCIGLLYKDLQIHITCSANQQMATVLSWLMQRSGSVSTSYNGSLPEGLTLLAFMQARDT